MSALDNLRPLDRERLSHIGQKFHQHRPVFQMPNPAAHAAIVFENHGRLREITPLCKYFRRDKRFQRSMVEWLRGQRSAKRHTTSSMQASPMEVAWAICSISAGPKSLP